VLRPRLEGEADDRSRFVQQKGNKPWRWIAMDAQTRQVLACHGGNRSRQQAQRLGAKMPVLSRHHATCDPDQGVADAGVMRTARPQAISQWARQTPPLERFHDTWRQRVCRLVREAWSWSQKRAHHRGALTLGICHDHLTSAAASGEHDMERTTRRITGVISQAVKFLSRDGADGLRP
jgi:insertion element IS1 protein InsB